MEKEIRTFEGIRANTPSRMVEGMGIVFNKRSRDLGGFIEVILPEAVEGVFEKSDVLALLNHDITKGVLARSQSGKGSLKLDSETDGVKYSFKSPKYNLGQELLEGIERGDINSSSFSFAVGEGGDRWEKLEDGIYLRTIMRFAAIYDISPCYRGAYQDTTVAVRSLDEFRKVEDPEVNLVEAKPDVANTTSEPIVEPEETEVVRDDYELNLRKLNIIHKIKNLK